ncbi:MAG: hypothetical protein JSW01_04875 [Candidatus Bathyarchaeota archaeon]|nr:MAG: hypothetical protein JSW01_04875 [Candidatus Bathyarchaeota archaeon]
MVAMSNNDVKQESTRSTDSDAEYLLALPPAEIYRSTLAYFSEMPGVKVIKKREPNEIVLQIGSLTTPELGDERGSLSVHIDEEKQGSRVRVSFSFVLPYLLSAVYWCFIWLILISAISLVFPGIWRLAYIYSNILLFFTIVFIGFGVGYSVGKTREKFLPQLNIFFKTLEYRRSRQ